MAESELQEKMIVRIAELRNQLMDDLSMEEMQRLQLHVDLLEQAISPLESHHHDTNEHHEHSNLR
jgi:hypothetical protein